MDRLPEKIQWVVQFYPNWIENVHGFGKPNGEHCMGLDSIHCITDTNHAWN